MSATPPSLHVCHCAKCRGKKSVTYKVYMNHQRKKHASNNNTNKNTSAIEFVDDFNVSGGEGLSFIDGGVDDDQSAGLHERQHNVGVEDTGRTTKRQRRAPESELDMDIDLDVGNGFSRDSFNDRYSHNDRDNTGIDGDDNKGDGGYIGGDNNGDGDYDDDDDDDSEKKTMEELAAINDNNDFGRLGDESDGSEDDSESGDEGGELQVVPKKGRGENPFASHYDSNDDAKSAREILSSIFLLMVTNNIRYSVFPDLVELCGRGGNLSSSVRRFIPADSRPLYDWHKAFYNISFTEHQLIVLMNTRKQVEVTVVDSQPASHAHAQVHSGDSTLVEDVKCYFSSIKQWIEYVIFTMHVFTHAFFVCTYIGIPSPSFFIVYKAIDAWIVYCTLDWLVSRHTHTTHTNTRTQHIRTHAHTHACTGKHTHTHTHRMIFDHKEFRSLLFEHLAAMEEEEKNGFMVDGLHGINMQKAKADIEKKTRSSAGGKRMVLAIILTFDPAQLKRNSPGSWVPILARYVTLTAQCVLRFRCSCFFFFFFSK